MKKKYIVIGAGGHARVLQDILSLKSLEIIGFTDINPVNHGLKIGGSIVIGNDDIIFNYPADSLYLVNGLGSLPDDDGKHQRLYEYFKKLGYSFASLLHPSVVISQEVLIAEGVQVMAGAVVQTGSTLDENCIINTGAIIDHDCHIAKHVHIAPGAVLSGGVKVGKAVFIGAGAVVIPGVKIAAKSIVAAGAVVCCDVLEGKMVRGVPAREV